VEVSVEILVEAATGGSGVSTSPGVSKSIGLVSGDCGVVIAHFFPLNLYRVSIRLKIFLLSIARTFW
jgi:hypothetical protein